MFSRNLYRYGLLGYSIGLGHLVARAYGVDLSKILRARSLEEQRAFFETSLAPLFDKPVRALGKPRASCRFTASAFRRRNMRRSARARRTWRRCCASASRSSSCEFSIDGQLLRLAGVRPLLFRTAAPARCRPISSARISTTIRDRADRVEVLNRSFTEYLKSRPAAVARPLRAARRPGLDVGPAAERSVARDHPHRAPGARVIFRTAARAEPAAGAGRRRRCWTQWRYEAEQSRELTRRDRSAIYGGFHLYVLGGDMTSVSSTDLMNRTYRHQRHIYDFTRKYFLLGRDRLIAQPRAARRRRGPRDRLRHRTQSHRRRGPLSRRARLFGIDVSTEMLDLGVRDASPAPASRSQMRARPRATPPASIPRPCSGSRGSTAIFISYSLSMIPDMARR